MTTQNRLHCLLKQFDELADSQGDMVKLSAQDIALLMETCGFANRSEIAFYMKALSDKGLVNADCSPDSAVLQASITIDGYCYLDSLNEGVTRHPLVSTTVRM